jgi:SAM-dependent methyltransferase
MDYMNINWNEVWKELMAGQQAEDKAAGGSLWNKKENAERFWKRSRGNSDRTQATIRELPLTPESRVLDIGAGPGRLAIPIAEQVAHVTAVEPAEGMKNLLMENVEKQGIKNLDCVEKRWEDIDVDADLNGPYDVVLASFSLGVPDIRDAVMKMEQASSRYVYIYWFAGNSPWETHSENLWPKLYGREYIRGPKCDVMYNLLYNMGIYPDMHVFSMEYTNRFPSMDEALDFFKNRYVIETPEQEEILRNYISDTLVQENGEFVEQSKSVRVRICWEKEE